MTQTVREQLQALAKKWRDKADQYSTPVEVALCLSVSLDIESILATEPPAVTVRAGWITKDWTGVCWWDNKPHWWADSPEVRKHFWIHGSLHGRTVNCTFLFTDPWPDKPNGGPECCMEVR